MLLSNVLSMMYVDLLYCNQFANKYSDYQITGNSRDQEICPS